MNICRRLFLAVFLFVHSVYLWAQVRPQDACRVDDNRLLFTIDLQWTVAQRREVASLFDLDSAVLAGVWVGKGEIRVNGVSWRVKKISSRIVELSKDLNDKAPDVADQADVILIDDQMAGITMESTRESVPYGINRFTRFSSFQYVRGTARFFLPGRTEAKKVFLSGTFNNWSTSEMPMQRTDSGWIYHLKLKPGKYCYKYIVDGRWTNDPFNRQQEDDAQGGVNSVVFCYNHWFRLYDYPTAKRVVLAGSFNGWNQDELKMIKSGGVWLLNLYLRDGTHAYKYLVNGHWINDPRARVNRPDGAGHVNSFVGVGDSNVFILKGYPAAKQVVLSGNFNAWNTGELYMEKTPGGWKLPYALAPGMYEYKFIVDGDWISDPSNPVRSGGGDGANSVLVFKPNHTFTLEGHSDAVKVSVAGSFNGWNQDSYVMSRKDFKWIFPVRLQPGKYTYKFVVDHKWILDPANPFWEANEYGTDNSVIWIEP